MRNPFASSFVFFLGLALLGGCATGPRTDAVKDPAQYMKSIIEKTKKHKVLVFSMQSDLVTNQRQEEYMANFLNKQGFQAVGTRTFFTPRDIYTPSGILTEMRAKGVVGIMEINMGGKINADGFPSNFTLLYRELKVKKKYIVDKNYAVPAGAIIQLLLVMPMAKN